VSEETQEAEVVALVARSDAGGLAAVEARLNEFRAFVKRVLQPGIDYGVVPGTGDRGKATLFKAGAERILQLYSLTAITHVDAVIEDFDKTPPLIHYRVRVQVIKRGSGEVMGEGLGTCNSLETKYRYRTEWWKDRKSAPPDGEGWERQQGKWGAGYKRKMLNPETADLANTILKIAKKRALVDAALTVGAASEFFTQDLDDMVVNEAALKPQVSKPSKEALIEEHQHIGEAAEAEIEGLTDSVVFVKLKKALLEGFRSHPHRDNWLKKHKAELEAMPEKAKDELRGLFIRAKVNGNVPGSGPAAPDVGGSEGAAGPDTYLEAPYHGGGGEAGEGEDGAAGVASPAGGAPTGNARLPMGHGEGSGGPAEGAAGRGETSAARGAPKEKK
jgi:hypothetical protein